MGEETLRASESHHSHSQGKVSGKKANRKVQLY